MAIAVYTVLDGDEIENVALRTLGTATKWRDLVAFNSLRAPYFSNDPRDFFGVTLAAGALAGPLPAGALAVPLAAVAANGPNPALVDVGGSLLLTTTDARGALVWEVVTCSAYNAVTATVTLALGTQNAYPTGAGWALAGYEQPLRVLRTGDSLLVPDGPDVAIRPTDRLTDFLGTDVYIGDDGLIAFSVAQAAVGYATLIAAAAPASNLLIPAGLGLIATDGTRFVTTDAVILPATGGSSAVDAPVRSLLSGVAATIDPHMLTAIDPTSTAPIVATTITAVDNAQPLIGRDGAGDLLTASGIDNLRQAICHRLATRKGELPYFPSYGNDAFGALGMRNRFVAEALIEAEVIAAAAADDRVAAVQGGVISRTVDTLNLSIDVLPRGIGYTLTLRDLQIALLNQSATG